MGTLTGCPYDIDEEDILRAQCYALLSRLLSSPPDEAALAVARDLKGDDTPLGEALTALAETAGRTTAEQAEDEYNALFVGMTSGELLPYGSYYLTGFLHEKPLARLRGDMARLGMGLTEGVSVSEDHIALLCEMMHGMNTGIYGKPVPLGEQRKFFDAHIASWVPRFFEDLETAKSAAFYVPVGRVGRLFMAIEAEAFQMAA